MRKNKVMEVSEKSSKSNYSYSAKNESFLDGIIVPYLVRPMLKIVPWGLPANIITIISNTCVFLAFLIAMQAIKGTYNLWFLIPILILIYVIGDCTDGEQARRTKTGSPLGEFLDHFLDTFVTGELIISIFVAYGITKAWVIYPTLFIAYITQASAFWERFKNGKMTFGKFSSTETIFTLTLVITLAVSKTIREFVSTKLYSFAFVQKMISNPSETFKDVSLIEAILLLFAFFALVNSVITLIRTKGASVRFWLYILSNGIVTTVLVIANQCFDYYTTFILSLLNIYYIESLLTSIVMKKKDNHPDYLIAVVSTVLLILNKVNFVITMVYFAYAVIIILVRAIIFFVQNKKYWVWKNPLPEETK